MVNGQWSVTAVRKVVSRSIGGTWTSRVSRQRAPCIGRRLAEWLVQIHWQRAMCVREDRYRSQQLRLMMHYGFVRPGGVTAHQWRRQTIA